MTGSDCAACLAVTSSSRFVDGRRSCWRRPRGWPLRRSPRRCRTDDNQVRRVIREFNEDAMASLRPRTGGGPPTKSPASAAIVDAALARPGDLGEPGTRWTLRRLRRFVVRSQTVASISVEGLRQTLRRGGVTYQRTRTWKTSHRPAL